MIEHNGIHPSELTCNEGTFSSCGGGHGGGSWPWLYGSDLSSSNRTTNPSPDLVHNIPLSLIDLRIRFALKREQRAKHCSRLKISGMKDHGICSMWRAGQKDLQRWKKDIQRWNEGVIYNLCHVPMSSLSSVFFCKHHWLNQLVIQHMSPQLGWQ